ncbi:hypothetical protein Micbo1qcDRAFT_218203 [Microdochium bolleyi]|uniref:Thiol-specific monooxygenase n=1 Tax=Microdochium bolleyi TaxID=196109 RepID=A0A136IQ00_9PEZI|nr:hypothetical protein Micbo1qcDRAFT_218203 [Microdochium bolleyi]
MSPIALHNDPAIDRIAIIGAGPCGLAGAKYLAAENKFSEIVVFDQRAEPGGVWNYTAHSGVDDGSFTVPRTRPTRQPDTAIWTTPAASASPSASSSFGPPGDRPGSECLAAAAQFISPVYDQLETNIPHTLMNYSDAPFPQDCSLFPPHQVVRGYLQSYAEELRERGMLSLETQVLSVTPRHSHGSRDGGPVEGGGWDVRVLDLRTNEERTAHFDAVLVASGHYNDPFIPDIKGLAGFDKAHPGAISHSKFYRRPDQYVGKKVIIVGNSASGIDLSAQIGAVCQLPIIVSEKIKPVASAVAHPGGEEGDVPRVKIVPEIREFLPATRGVVYADGTTDAEVDAVIFCTGYFYSFPFLELPSGENDETTTTTPSNTDITSPSSSSSSSSSPCGEITDRAPTPRLLPPIITDGSHAAHLYQHILYTHDPTLAFLGIPQRVVPFPVSEAQAGWVARIWSGRLPTPSFAGMTAWEAELVARKVGPAGSGSEKVSRAALHNMAFPQDVEYINLLHNECVSARPAEGLENDGRGKVPPSWGADKAWIRERMPLIKTASRALGSKRHEIRSLEELGFDFVAWKKKKELEGLEVRAAAEQQIL